ncbi:hypothetical protein BBJ28_00006822 [Nothophytophthora sp. Chile5]|nr:hypothetical protein BBJ28_00006822 [Nothophytophthora sp. Chile5]
MGNLCCGAGDSEMLSRQELLKEGSDFKKKSAFLGVLSVQDLVIFAQNGQKLLELTAATGSVRDLWVQTLEELCLPGQKERSEDDAKGLKDELDKQVERQKEVGGEAACNSHCAAEYFACFLLAMIDTELEKRRLDAEERKKKIGLVGMKYTALAMANR